MRKQHLIVTISALIIIVIAMGWIYPFSFVSFNKSFTYSAEKSTIDEYTSKLEVFKNLYKTDEIQPDVTTSYIGEEEVQNLLSNPLFTTPNREIIHYKDLEQLQKKINTFRLKLTHLDRTSMNTYNAKAQRYLYLLLDNSEYMEIQVEKMLDSDFSTKSNLRDDFEEVHVSMITMIEHLTTFYQAYLNGS
ncbi:hypothetical protein [Aquibacillus sediminis]|uniref:hypothetical protein n=1 Tax=Aquibacillus sediminis TaxID=2574734 RepID=UPI001109BCC7|nr:hypothetical protein [Aquibacillus sediminis]